MAGARIASQPEVIRAICCLGERIASQSEVIRAIASDYIHSPCACVPHRGEEGPEAWPAAERVLQNATVSLQLQQGFSIGTAA